MTSRTLRPSKPAHGGVRRRGRPSRGDTEATRQRVLAAARHAFATQGFSGATMRNIARDAGLTPMALYNYAPSKAVLFETVWQESMRAVYLAYGAELQGRRTLLGEVETLLDYLRRLLKEDPDLVRILVRVIVEREHAELAGVNLRVPSADVFFADLTARSVARGEISRRDRQRLGTLVGTLLWGIAAAGQFDADQLDDVVDAVRWAARRWWR